MMTPSTLSRPAWVADVDADPAAEIDVGRLLAQGGDPLSTLTGTAATVPAGRGMVVVAPFDPVPLRDLLAGDGFESFVEPLADGRFRVRFFRAGGCAAARSPAPPAPAAEPPRKFWMDADGLHLDVRGLPPPRPMLDVLAFLDGGAHSQPLTVHVPQFPVHLVPELEDRGWSWDIVADEPGHVILRLVPDETA
ncbi:DUF2249 domain-containing protein [Caenispirillum bisanense]|uniref:Uncharacterized conserved protein n=1 Tax=Caenispirillum bisanense TaxID=414052 RepID=A0A286GN26_9PROT|nr:DUF2249 domain-containing protein [Caenispirillum bisanense]SOD96928.1 Uncharacterized conserved protein [Caenispirillum bisanense]